MEQNKIYFSLYPFSMHNVWHIKKYYETCKEAGKYDAQSREKTIRREKTNKK